MLLSKATAEFFDEHPSIDKTHPALIFAYDTANPARDRDSQTNCTEIFPPDFRGLVHLLYVPNRPSWYVYREDHGIPYGQLGRHAVARLAIEGDNDKNLERDVSLLLTMDALTSTLGATLAARRDQDKRILRIRELHPDNPYGQRMKLLSERVQDLRSQAGKGTFKLSR